MRTILHTMLACVLLAGTASAQDTSKPVIAEGIVPDQASKALILARLHEVYGAERVVDRLQVESIPTLPNWGEYVANMVGPGLRRVSDGALEVNGQAVRITGQVVNEAQRQQVASELSLASSSRYTVTNSLDEMASGLREIGDARVQIVGHTDDIGARQGNIALSQARALAVRDYLVGQGIPVDNLSVLGRGPDEPIADNATDDGRARNRRIQFKVL